MTEQITPEFPEFDTMTPAEFEKYLPELFAASENGRVSAMPALQDFFAKYPDCAALVRDLETIADTARGLFEPTHEPSDLVWNNIQSRMGEESPLTEQETETE